MAEFNIPHMETLKRASALTGLSYSFLRKGCISGDIVHIKSGNRFLVNIDKLIEQLNEGCHVEQ